MGDVKNVKAEKRYPVYIILSKPHTDIPENIIWIWEYQTEFRILLDTLSHFVHLLNVLVRWNLVKQIFAASGDKLFVV